ncbi:regulatory protein, luxR family [Vreelandella subterranea]|uniref:Regulatory protein, luxR family n=1 Tax=Vreelandella subterranea TaxID=416874 RepID=A0A1H9UR78_9GAMM|nr:LuxR C-terminal-related transcriptional regulator [Halomonas subterranea]SES11839.1 regulatory protein, luxR family [Halomonas subterranea]
MQITHGNWQATINAERGGLGFTRMEATYLLHLANGCTQKEIAKAVGRQPTTVKHCLERAYQKLNVTRGTAAVAEAMNRRWIERISCFALLAPFLLALIIGGINPDVEPMRHRPPMRTRTQVSASRTLARRDNGSLYA